MSRLCVRVINAEDEVSFYQSECYDRRPAENPATNALTLVGALAGLVLIGYWLGSVLG